MKICGITEPDTLAAAVAGGARWIGVNLYPPSPRAVRPDEARRLAALLPQGVVPVCLLVSPDAAAVDAALGVDPRAAIQVYADEAEVAAIRARTGREVWRAVPLAPGEAPPAATAADRLVIEAAPDATDTLPGGNGRRLDWGALRGWRPPVPWLLAGGLTPGNVAEAIAASGAVAVDVSSGVEHVRGRKDKALIRRFLAAAAAGSAPVDAGR